MGAASTLKFTFDTTVTTDRTFELKVNNDDLTMALAQTGSACTEDFIIIEGSSSTCTLNPNTNRYCGSHLNDDNMAKASVSICDCTSPFEIRVITDGEFDA